MRPLRNHLSSKVLSMIGVPKHFQNISIEDFNTFDIQDLLDLKSFIKSYLDNLDYNFENNVGLLIRGSNGVGKSMITSLIIKEAYRHRYTSKRLTFMEYLNVYSSATFASGDEKEELEGKFYNDIKAVEFLVLEEVGKETQSKDNRSTFHITVLEDCLRYREEKGLVTILCTNMTSQDFSNRYGNSILSIIKGNCISVDIVGTDRRPEEFRKKLR